MIKYYKNLPIKKRRELRTALNQNIELTKEEIAIFEKNLIKPLKDMLNLIDDVIKNKIPIEEYIEKRLKLNKHIKKYFESGENG